MKRKSDINDLRWVRLFTSSHIPVYLVDQIKNRDYISKNLFRHLESQILKYSQEGPTLNPLFHLWALVDTANLVKGFLWFTVDPLTQDMVIQIYSVDCNYWGKGAVKKLADHMKILRKKADLKKIYWITECPKHSEKYGFKASKNILMEYNIDYMEEEEKKDGKDNHGKPRDAKSSEAGAVKLPPECS